MYSRILMTASAAFMGAMGLAGTFLPAELLVLMGTAAESNAVLVVQLAGALYLGFALLNWAARGVLIGGIYARPVAIGNFCHCFVASLTLLKKAFSAPPPAILIVTAVYLLFAVCFGIVVFSHPGARAQEP